MAAVTIEALSPSDPRAEHAAGTRRLSLDGGLDVPEGTTTLALDLAGVEAGELRGWSHQVDTAGTSADVASDAVLRDAEGERALGLAQRSAAVPRAGGRPSGRGVGGPISALVSSKGGIVVPEGVGWFF